MFMTFFEKTRADNIEEVLLLIHSFEVEEVPVLQILVNAKKLTDINEQLAYF